MAASTGQFTQSELIAYVQQQAASYGLDPAAVLAVANEEGLGGGYGDPTDPNNPIATATSFGPWQLHIGGALPSWVGALGPQFAQQWAWSSEGVNYALQQMAGVAKGQTGQTAVTSIVTDFERPKNVLAEIENAVASLGLFGGSTTTTTTTDTGGTPTPPTPPVTSGSPPVVNDSCQPPATNDTPIVGGVLTAVATVNYWACVVAFDVQRLGWIVLGLVLVVVGFWVYAQDKDAPGNKPVTVVTNKAKDAAKTAASAAVAA